MISSLELARLCGVSQGTVDRALHGRPGIRASTREMILAEAARYGYRPNPAVHEVLTGTSRVVSAVVPSLDNVFFMDVLAEVAAGLEMRGLRLQLSPAGSRERFLEVLQDAAGRRHRMALVVPPEEGIEISVAESSGIPIVSLFSPCAGSGVRFLSIDEERTGRDAVIQLHGLGHRRIAHLTYARPAHAIEARARGYEEEMKRRGLEGFALRGFAPEDVLALVRREGVTALFCHNDWLAIRVLLVLSEAGVRVPQEVSVLGVDGTPTLVALHPELTTLAYPVKEVVGAVLASLDGVPTDLSGVRCEYIDRRTVGAPPVARTADARRTGSNSTVAAAQCQDFGGTLGTRGNEGQGRPNPPARGGRNPV